MSRVVGRHTEEIADDLRSALTQIEDVLGDLQVRAGVTAHEPGGGGVR